MKDQIKFNIHSAGLYGLLVVCLALTACGGTTSDGGGQSAGIGGTGIVYGKVTGFGSIFVNGGEYNTDDSKFTVDGNTAATQDDISLGMVVRLKVATKNGKLGSRAIEVDYDDEVQGPISGISPLDPAVTQRTFKVFGQTVTVGEVGTLFKDTSFDTLADNDLVEISGFRTSPAEITATYVEHKGSLAPGSEVELRGSVSGYTPLTMEFVLDGVLITFDGTTELDLPNGTLKNGSFVEVKGSYQTMPVRVHAEKIEREDDSFGNNVDDISLQGIISNFNDIGDFEINGQKIDASGAELEPANAAGLLDDGVEVEVEGNISGGVLVADKLELRQSESELRAVISGVDLGDGSFTVSYPVMTGPPTEVVVRIDSQTVFEDDSGAAVTPPFSLDDLVVGNFVRVEGQEVNDEVVASVVKRRDSVDDSLKLEGLVDAYDPGNYITVLGIQYDLGAGTSYSPDPPDIAVGDRIEIEDDNDPLPADGVADGVQVDD